MSKSIFKKAVLFVMVCTLTLTSFFWFSGCAKKKEMTCDVEVGISKTEDIKDAEGARVKIDTDYFLILNLAILNPSKEDKKVSVKMVFENSNMLAINGFKGDSKPSITPVKDATGSNTITIDNMEFNIKGGNRETNKQNIFAFRASQPIPNGSIDIYVYEGETELVKKFVNYEFYLAVPTNKLPMPHLRISDGVLRWEAIEHATRYILSRNEVIEKQLDASVTSYNVDAFSYTKGPISIVACGDGVDYSDSETNIMVDESIKFKDVAKNIKVGSDGFLRWDSYGNESIVYINGRKQAYGAETQKVDLSLENDGLIKIGVVVKGNDEFFDSQKVVIEAIKLATPTKVRKEGLMIKWDAVDNANQYEIFVDGKSFETVTSTKWKISVTGKEISVCVKAVANGKNVISSNVSVPIICAIY